MMGALRTPWLMIGLCAALLAHAQPQWSAPLKPVAADGYHTIVLSPELVGRSRADLSDVRLLDSAGVEVPFILEQEPAMYERMYSRPYALLRNAREGKHTVIEMQGDSAGAIDEIVLNIRNADVHKRARITGSDDRTSWFMIKDDCIGVGEAATGTSLLRFVDLPLSDYRYYRIVLDDSLTAPVQVKDLGHWCRERTEGRYTRVDGVHFGTSQHQQVTHIALVGTTPFLADRVVFHVQQEGPYAREGRFIRRSKESLREKRRTVERMTEETVGVFTLRSGHGGTVTGPGVACDTLFARIADHDDRPLRITGVSAFQLERRLKARLKADQRYTITTADEKVKRPTYDIQQFRDSLPASVAVLTVPTMSPRPITQEEGPAVAPSLKWVWAAIVGIGLAIGISAVRLLRKQDGTTTNG